MGRFENKIEWCLEGECGSRGQEGIIPWGQKYEFDGNLRICEWHLLRSWKRYDNLRK
jgi:hypothetical protein